MPIYLAVRMCRECLKWQNLLKILLLSPVLLQNSADGKTIKVVSFLPLFLHSAISPNIFPVLVDVSFPKRADSCNVIIKGYDLAGVTSGVDQSYIKWVKNSETTEFPEFSICMRFLVFLNINPDN